jgi:hypothetical protein
VPIHPVDFHKLIAERFHLPKPYDPKSRPSWADISGQ